MITRVPKGFISATLLICLGCCSATATAILRPLDLPLEHTTLQVRSVGNCDDPDASEALPYAEQGKKDSVCLKQPVLADENDLSDINASKDANGRPLLSLTFKEKGAARLKKATAAMVGKRIVLLVNGQIFAVATLAEMISREVALVGRFSEDELQRLVNSLKSQILLNGQNRTKNRVGT